MGQQQSGAGSGSSNTGHGSAASRARQPDDLYELLGVSQDATGDDIKKAFRKLALREHPDKVPEDRRAEANERFGKILRAFEVLSDDQERAWYDSHRDGFGAQPEEDLDVRSTPAPAAPGRRSPKVTTNQLLRFFNPDRFGKMDDSPNGFFAQYRTLFDLIVADEAQAYALPGETLDPLPAYPSFGSASSSYESGPSPIRQFYSKWLNFSTRKAFTEVDRYNVGEAPDRRYKRAMDKENQRARDQAKRDFNDTVRVHQVIFSPSDARRLSSRSSRSEIRASSTRLQRIRSEPRPLTSSVSRLSSQRRPRMQQPSERSRREITRRRVGLRPTRLARLTAMAI